MGGRAFGASLFPADAPRGTGRENFFSGRWRLPQALALMRDPAGYGKNFPASHKLGLTWCIDRPSPRRVSPRDGSDCEYSRLFSTMIVIAVVIALPDLVLSRKIDRARNGIVRTITD